MITGWTFIDANGWDIGKQYVFYRREDAERHLRYYRKSFTVDTIVVPVYN